MMRSAILLLFVAGCLATEPPPTAPEVAAQPESAEGQAAADGDSTMLATDDGPAAAPNDERQAGSDNITAKTEQCKALIGAINDAQGPLKDVKGNEPSGLEKLATTLDGVVESIGAVEVSDTKLVELRDAYAAMARDLAKASRDTADALRAKDDKKAKERAKTMATSGPRERQIVDEINVYCAP
jgi:hypothetical protein